MQSLQGLWQTLHAADHQQRAGGLQRVGGEGRQLGQPGEGFGPMGWMAEDDVDAGRRHQSGQVGQGRLVQGDVLIEGSCPDGKHRRRLGRFVPLAFHLPERAAVISGRPAF